MNLKYIPLALGISGSIFTGVGIAAENKTQIETITVLGKSAIDNASLGGINLKDLPLNAHVVSQTEIERIRFVDPDELLDRIPGETQVRN